MARAVPASAIRLALSGLRLWPASNEKISLEYKLKRFLEGCLLTPERAHIYWNGTFSEEGKDRPPQAPATRRDGRDSPPVARRAYTRTRALAHISLSISNTSLPMTSW